MMRVARFTAILFVFAALTTFPARAQRRDDGDRQPRLDRGAATQIDELLAEKEHRTKAQRKIDSQLLYASKMHQGQRLTPHIESLETGVEIDDDGLTVVDITAIVSDAFLGQLRGNGVHVLYSFPQYNSVRVLMPLDGIETIAAMPQVIWIQPKQEATTSQIGAPRARGVADDLPAGFSQRAARVRESLAEALSPLAPRANDAEPNSGTGVGSRSSEGDIAHRAFSARGTFGVTGAGVKIGVLSDGVTNLAASQALGDLGAVTVLAGQAGSGDEGTAMLEIVHDLAPGAQLFFATAFNGIASFAQNIRDLRTAGCDVIVDDVFYFVETPFQDGQAPGVISTTNGGVVIQAVNDVTAAGAMYFSSAGNSGNLNDGTAGAWEGDFVDGGPTAAPLPLGNRLHSFGSQTFNVLTALPSSTSPITIYWSDPLGGAANDYDLFRLNAAGTAVLSAATNIQSGTQDPIEQFAAGTTANARIVIVKKTASQPRFIHLNTNRGRLQIATSGTIHGHAGAANALGCAATPAAAAFPNSFNPGNVVETFSSDGPRRVFFNPNSSAITPGNVSSTGGLLRQKPDITAADGVSVTGVGGFPSPFFGTSAAAPHGAAIAGLIKSANPAFTQTQIRSALTSTAIDIEAPGTDRDSGAGIILAWEAVRSLGVTGGPSPEIALVTAAEAPGNGNGVLEAGEGATLFITLKNNGVVTAANVVGTLTTSTPGIVLAAPTALGFPNLAVNASAANATPFRFAVQPGVVCPTTIEFVLNVTTTGALAPHALSFSVATGRGANVTTTFGSAPPSGTGFTSSTGTQTVRIFRDGVASVCATPKAAFPGTTASGITRRFEAYTFNLCPNATSSCVRVTMAGPSAINLFVAAYKDTYYPTNLATNYLADPGSSASSRTFDVVVPSGHNLVVVVNDVTPPGGANVAYTLTVAGCVSTTCSTPNRFPLAAVQNVTVSAGPTCTATASVDNGSSDPDGDALTFTQSPAAPYPLGVTPVLMTVFDTKGAFAQASANVTVVDTTKPVLSCPADITVSNDPNSCSAFVTTTATATDNCSTPTVTGVRSDGQTLSASYPVGTTTIAWTATDAAGNFSTCQQKVTVNDTQAPGLNVPAPIIAEFVDETGAPVSFTVTASDNCPGVTRTCAPASGSTFPIGTTAVTCVATDTAGNTTTKSFNVTVLGALGVKSNVFREISGLKTTTDIKELSDGLGQVLDDLQVALDPSLWLNQTHVDPKNGDRGFQAEKDAVNVLRNLIKSHVSPTDEPALQNFIDRIVRCDRLLATFAINDATAAGGDATMLKKALSERLAGDGDIAAGQLVSGIEHYRNSWSFANKSRK